MDSKFHQRLSLILAFGFATLAFSAAVAQDYDTSWHTIDNGGITYSAGSAFSLGGTIGQPDAGSMSGGAFQLTGGFWPAAAETCTCPGDLNGDGAKNGLDVQQFVACMVADGSCTCADVDGIGGAAPADVAIFVDDLVSGDECP